MKSKRILSILCSLSMAISTFVGFSVAKADEELPTIYTKLEEKIFNEELEGVPQYVLTIGIKNLSGFSITKSGSLTVKWTGKAIKNIAFNLGYDPNKVLVFGEGPEVLLPTSNKSVTTNPNKVVDGVNAYYLTWQTSTSSEYIFEGNGTCTDASAFEIAKLYLVPIDGYDGEDPIVAEAFTSNPISFVGTTSVLYNTYESVAASKGTQAELSTYDNTLAVKNGEYPEATAAVTGITISPETATVEGGATQEFTVAVQGTGDYDATYTLSATAGSFVGNVYTAPEATAEDQTITITATAKGDTSKTATATVTVPKKSSTPTTVEAVAGKTIENGYKTFSAPAPAVLATSAENLITVTKSDDTERKLTHTLPAGVVGGKTKVLPIVSYKLGVNGVNAADVFTITVTSGSDTIATYTYTVPAE